jgi:aconitate hydratase
MAYLQFEAIGWPKVQTEVAVSYVDHNMLQTNFRNADDHKYLQSAAARFGAYFSRPGNGICHQVHLERFGIPGKILLGSDSHTPTGGGLGMIAVGVGGIDISTTMAGEPFCSNDAHSCQSESDRETGQAVGSIDGYHSRTSSPIDCQGRRR